MEKHVVVMLVEVTVKAGMESEFLRLIENDALHSESDEPGCLRFDVLQDDEDPRRYFFYEAYEDDAAYAAHMQTPHLKGIDARIADLFDSATVHRTHNVFPAGESFRR